MKNFTPFFENLGKYKPDPAIKIITSLFVIAVVLVGFNQFTDRQLASTSCTTSTSLSSMISTQLTLQSQIYDTEAKITTNNSTIISLNSSLVTKNGDIVKTTSLILSDYTMSQEKLKLDKTYAYYLKSKTAKTKQTYDTTFKNYRTLLATNNSYKTQLTTLNTDKASLESQLTTANTTATTLSATLTSLQTQLNTLNTAVKNVQMCETATTTTTTGGSSYVANTGSGSPCNLLDEDTSNDCEAGESCYSYTCHTTGDGACNGDPDCNNGDVCGAGACVNNGTAINCTDPGACNTVGPCEYISCKNIDTDTCNTDEYDEMGWRFEINGAGFRITNEDETNGCSTKGVGACDPEWDDFKWEPEQEDRWMYVGKDTWGCKITQYNCKTGKVEPREAHCSL